VEKKTVSQLPGKRAQAEKAREMLMHGIGNVLGYWHEEGNPFASSAQDDDGNWTLPTPLTEGEKEEFGRMLQREADRIARMFDYDEAWSN
jgi:hypothetical protein